MKRIPISFYCDDTNPYGAPPEAFSTFLDFSKDTGIAGESSVILGAQYANQGLLTDMDTDAKRTYVADLQRAYDCGMDAHMELLTHSGLFDFENRRVPEGAMHEGLWLHTDGKPAEEYEAYFDAVISEAESIGVRLTGLTWPGCSCEACMSVYRVLDATGRNVINPNVYKALLRLAVRGRFRGRAVPCFVSEDIPGCAYKLMARCGDRGVFDLPPNLADRFSRRSGAGAAVPGNPDDYITEDGTAGCIPEAIASGAGYCLFWTHWWTINPFNGPGWRTFQTVVERVNTRLGDLVVWLRPSEIAERLMPAD